MSDLRAHLQAIYDKHSDLTPELVVREARPKRHPLHDRFEWDDAIAGEAWRRQQAHELIASVRIRYRSGDGSECDVRAFVAVRREDRHQPSYEPVETVAEDPFKVRLVLAEMERDWRTLRSRYEALAEFWAMVKKDVEGAA